MTQKQQSGKRKTSALSLWFQRKMNARTNNRIRRKPGKVMGMDSPSSADADAHTAYRAGISNKQGR